MPIALLRARARAGGMRAGRRVWLGLVLGGLLSSAAVGPARACYCAPVDRAGQLEAVDAILLGRVSGPGVAWGAGTGGKATQRRYPVEVQRALKGSATGTISVATPASPAQCGSVFQAGVRYLIFARRLDDGALQTTLCDSNVRGEEADRIAKKIQALIDAGK